MPGEEEIDNETPEVLDAKASAVALEHARSSWAAEEENAARLHRERQVSTAILVAVFAAGFSAVAKYLPSSTSTGQAFTAPLLMAAVAAFVYAFYKLIPLRFASEKSPEEDPPSASWRLHELTPDELAGASEAQATYLTYITTYNAAYDLADRNLSSRQKYRRGAAALAVGLAFGFSALFIIILTQQPVDNVVLSGQKEGYLHDSAQRTTANPAAKSSPGANPQGPGASAANPGTSSQQRPASPGAAAPSGKLIPPPVTP